MNTQIPQDALGNECPITLWAPLVVKNSAELQHGDTCENGFVFEKDKACNDSLHHMYRCGYVQALFYQKLAWQRPLECDPGYRWLSDYEWSLRGTAQFIDMDIQFQNSPGKWFSVPCAGNSARHMYRIRKRTAPYQVSTETARISGDAYKLPPVPEGWRLANSADLSGPKPRVYGWFDTANAHLLPRWNFNDLTYSTGEWHGGFVYIVPEPVSRVVAENDFLDGLGPCGKVYLPESYIGKTVEVNLVEPR